MALHEACDATDYCPEYVPAYALYAKVYLYLRDETGSQENKVGRRAHRASPGHPRTR